MPITINAIRRIRTLPRKGARVGAMDAQALDFSWYFSRKIHT